MTEVNQTNEELTPTEGSISIENNYTKIAGPAEWVGQFNNDEPFIIFFEPDMVDKDYLESPGRKLELALPPLEGLNLIEFKSKDGQVFKITARPKSFEDMEYTDFEESTEPTAE